MNRCHSTPVAALALCTILIPPPAPAQTASAADTEPCSHSPICAWGKARNLMVHEERTPDLGFTYAYPFALPAGLTGGISAVAINSKGHLFAFERNRPGEPQLFEFDENRKLVRTIGEDAIGHQSKAHGMAIDAADNIWICDENGATVMKLSPEGKVLMTLGVKGQRGDWDEARGQRLLWQPLALAFAPNGDLYIGMGHANESPNDTDKSPSNSSGAARILQLDEGQNLTGTGLLATMGPGLSYAIAAQLAFPKRQSVAIVGDGGFAQLMAEFATAVKYQLPVKILVLSNRSLAEVRKVFVARSSTRCAARFNRF